MSYKIFKITLTMKKRRRGYGLDKFCSICNVKIKTGDIVVTRNTGSHRRIRHESCAKKLGLV